jgi:hypothetical protein
MAGVVDMNLILCGIRSLPPNCWEIYSYLYKKGEAVPLHSMEELGGGEV